MSHRVYVGTIGEGMFRSVDGGQTFRRACEGMFVECHVRALAVHPRDANTIYLGSEHGVFLSADAADSWTRLPAPLEGMQVWSICLAPSRPQTIIVGTCPSRIFKSDDAGQSWREADARMQRECPRIMFTRVTCVTSDPNDPNLIWAGVEIDGVYRSRDAGRTWQAIGSGLSSKDIHALVVVPRRGGTRRLLAATNNDLNISDDDGETWRPLKIGNQLPWSYCRGMGQLVGQPEVVLLGTGDGPPGTVGAVARSTDAGETWKLAAMPARSNSTMWNFAVHPAAPDRIYAASVSGQVYRSEDGGKTWEKLAREFGEIRALAWAP
jgi:photosystem II stability/assembly factor-like uncharacterized protein